MAKKKRKKKSYVTLPRPKSSEGLEHLRSGRFKNAIESLKLALKEEPQSDELKDYLAEAYIGRAKELAEKGMGQEAAIMLEKSSDITGKLIDPIMLFSLFLNGGQVGRAVDALRSIKGDPDGRSSLVVGPLGDVLAGLALVGHVEVLTLFDEDSSFVSHHSTALKILQAYDEGKDETSLELLKKLPIGSPFKNFRLFMHALILSSSQPKSALALLEKVKEDSPFHSMAQAVKIAISEDHANLGTLSTLPGPANGLACRLLNINVDTIRSIRQIESYLPNPDKLIKALLKQDMEAIFPKETLESICLSLLPSAIGQLENFQQRFDPLPLWEVQRIRALSSEEQERWSSAADNWIMALKHMTDPVMKALIYRHLADFPHYEDKDRDPWDMLDFGNRSEYSKTDFLELSLQYDPKDRDTHLQLIRLRERKNQKGMRTAVDRAVREFPEDRDILEAAMDAAFAAKTFKKAVTFAERILSVNPIHQRARSVLIESHLAHARKKAGEKRLDLANKELLVAESLEKEHARSGRVQICQAMIALLNGQKQTGEERLCVARKLQNRPLEIELMIQAEAVLLKVPSTLMTDNNRNFKDLSINTFPDRVSVLSLIRELEHYLQDGHLPVRGWIETLLPFFDKAPAFDFSLEERRLICNILFENDFFETLGLFANAGKKQWENDISFLFFDLSSQSKGNAVKARREELEILQEAKGSMNSRLDARTMRNMQKFLSTGRALPFNIPFGNFPFDDDDDDEEDFFDIDNIDVESELNPLLEMFETVIRSRIMKEYKLRQKLGDEKYGEKLAKELSRGLPMGIEIFRELVSEILSSTPLPDAGTKK
ncbi:MAG: hypothetical protein HQL78_11765 [Magnetococcales bacterium]|nr:hypothetical protein [Magnetococcales bacterium]